MKQSLFMLLLLLATLPWTLLNPFAGLAVYYGLALLRPQALWQGPLAKVDWRFSMVVALVTVVSFILHGLARKRAGRRWPAEKILMAVFAGLAVLSFLFAVDRVRAAIQFDSLVKIFVMFFVACALLDSRHRLRVLAIVIVVTMGYVAMDFNQRYIFMGQTDSTMLRFDQLDNNGLAALMVMGMPFCVFLFSQERRWYLKWPPLLALLFMLHLVMFSMSRGGMLGAMVVLPLVLLRLHRRWVGVLILVVMLLAGLRLAGPMVRQRFFSIEQYQADRSVQGRFAAWRTAGEVVADHPFLGVGQDCFSIVVSKYTEDIDAMVVHNQILQTAADMGVPAAGAHIGIILAALVHLHRLRRRFRQDPFVHDLASCLQASLIGYIVVGMFLSIGTIELTYIALAMVVGLRNVTTEELLQPAPAPAPAKAKPSPALPATGAKPAIT